ncbi:hypothetical protein VTJ49DRAFT_146 [Mycothermus thermophilus]|uniref:DUF4048 domain-containing protein n=1 Tax=Humicola insolens TaxID=85995 RepID=A0ABR3VG47_HUMIN
MLRRRSTKSKLSLTRRKSTSTSSAADIHHRASIVVLEHLDPALARRDAHIAASEAYARAQSRALADVSRAFIPMASSSQAGHDGKEWSTDTENTGRNTLRRSQSVRFVGSCSTSADGNGTRNVSTDMHSSLNPAPLLSKTAQGYIDALTAGDEYYTPEDDVASAPSSSETAASLGMSSRDESVDEHDHESVGEGVPATPLPDKKEEQHHAATAAATLRLRARNASRSFRTKLRSLFGSSNHSQSKSEDDGTQENVGTKGPEIPLQHIPSRRGHHYGPSLIFPSRNPSSSTTSGGGGESNDSSSLTSWVHSGPSTLTSVEQRQWREWEAKQQALREQLEERLRVIKGEGGNPGGGRDEAGQTPSALALPPRPMVSSDRIYSALVKRMREKDGRALPLALATGQAEQQRLGKENIAPTIAAVAEDSRGDRYDNSKTPDTIRRVIVPRPSAEGGEERRSDGASRASVSSSEQTTIMNTPTRTSRRSGGGGGSMSRAACGPLPRQREGQVTTTSNLRSQQVRHTGSLGVLKPSSSFASMATDVSGQRRWREEVENDAHDHHADAGGSPGSDHLFRTESRYRRALERSMMEEEQKVWARQASGGDWDSRDGGAGDDEGAWGQNNRVEVEPAERGTDTGSGDDQLRYSVSVYSSDEGEDVTPLRRTRAGDGREAHTGNDGMSSSAYGNRGGALRETSTASSTDWKMWLSAHAGKLEVQREMSPPPEHLSLNEGLAGRGYGLTVDSLNRQLRGSLSGRGHIREGAQIDDDDDDDRDHSEDDRSYYGDMAYNARHAGHKAGQPNDVFHPTSHQRRVSQQHAPPTAAAAAMIEYQHPAEPLKQVEPNLPSLHSHMKHPSGWDTSMTGSGNVSGQVNENRNPSTRHSAGHPQNPHPLPPPISAKSKFRPEPLRPEPLRVARQRPFRGGEQQWKGIQGLQGPPSPSMASVLSSPGLTEALRRQFGNGGGGGGGGGGGMSSLSEVVAGVGAGSVKGSPGGGEGSSGVYAFV